MPLKLNYNKLKVYDKILVVFNVVFSLALLTSYLAQFIDPRSISLIAFAGLAYPFLLFMNVVFFIYWLLKQKFFFAISVISILLGYRVLMANFGFRTEGPMPLKPGADNIRVMVYNVHNFMGLDTLHRSFIQDNVFKLINNEQPDIVSLQEFSVNIVSSKDIYAGARKSIQSDQYYFKPYNLSAWDTIGVAILSRFPIIRHGVILSFKNQPQIEAIFVDVKCGKRTFRVYSLHLKSINLQEQDHNYIKKLTHRANINVYELSSIVRKLKIAFQKRADQVALIKEHAGKCPYPYIITGDFNDTPISFAVRQISKGLKNAFVEKGSGSGITYFGDFPHFQIDYILASQQFNVINYQTVKQKISDHYPILSDLELK